MIIGDFTFMFLIIEWSGLISNTLLPFMNSRLVVSPDDCAFISLLRYTYSMLLAHQGKRGENFLLVKKVSYLSMFADQPNLPDTRTQGDELRRLEI